MFGIRTVYSTSGLASPTLVAAAVLGDITQAFAAAGGLFSADELAVRTGDALDGRSVEEIRGQHGGLVIALRRRDITETLPALGTTLAPGDTITLLAPLEDLARLRAALERR